MARALAIPATGVSRTRTAARFGPLAGAGAPPPVVPLERRGAAVARGAVGAAAAPVVDGAAATVVVVLGSATVDSVGVGPTARSR
jgi:hypothetical protein